MSTEEASELEIVHNERDELQATVDVLTQEATLQEQLEALQQALENLVRIE